MMVKIKLTGSHYEIGLRLGAIVKRTHGYPPKYPKEVLEQSRAYEEQVRIYAPDLLDEFRGIADSLDMDYYIPVTLVLQPHLVENTRFLGHQPPILTLQWRVRPAQVASLAKKQGLGSQDWLTAVVVLEASPYRFETTCCLVMAISGEHTKSGIPVLARNHEWMEEDSKNLRLCYTKPDGKLESLGFTFHWPLVSRYGGINQAGLALSSASATFENAGPGIMLNLATRWILDTCRTTREAVEYLEKMPKVWGETYIVIDKENNIAKVEAHREKTKITYTDTGFASNSLLYDSPEMIQYMSQERIESCIEYTSARRAFLSEWFLQNKGNITDHLIIDALKSHEHKLCYHDHRGLEICWSYILKIGANNALLCAGRPCKNEFVKVEGP